MGRVVVGILHDMSECCGTHFRRAFVRCRNVCIAVARPFYSQAQHRIAVVVIRGRNSIKNATPRCARATFGIQLMCARLGGVVLCVRLYCVQMKMARSVFVFVLCSLYTLNSQIRRPSVAPHSCISACNESRPVLPIQRGPLGRKCHHRNRNKYEWQKNGKNGKNNTKLFAMIFFPSRMKNAINCLSNSHSLFGTKTHPRTGRPHRLVAAPKSQANAVRNCPSAAAAVADVVWHEQRPCPT